MTTPNKKSKKVKINENNKELRRSFSFDNKENNNKEYYNNYNMEYHAIKKDD